MRKLRLNPNFSVSKRLEILKTKHHGATMTLPTGARGGTPLPSPTALAAEQHRQLLACSALATSRKHFLS